MLQKVKKNRGENVISETEETIYKFSLTNISKPDILIQDISANDISKDILCT